MRGDTVRIGCGVTPHVIPRHDAVSRNTGKITCKIHFPLRPRAGPHIEVRGDTICSFFSTARRTNQEVPPLLSGFVARRLAPPSGAVELATLKHSSPSFLGRLASSRPDKGGVLLRAHSSPAPYVAAVIPHWTRYPEIPAKLPAKYIFLCDTCLDPASPCGVTRCASGAG